MNESIAEALKDWIPVKLAESSPDNNCNWLYLGENSFTEPFFGDSIAKCFNLPYNSGQYRAVSSVELLPQWSQAINSIAPTAFIFHVSRCGSTLIAQMLALDPANIVLSEVPFFDELFRHGLKNNYDASYLVKAAMRFYGARRNAVNNRLFIKADSWHIHFYKELRALYPTVPFILLYRRPDEVIRSQQKRRGMQAVPGLLEPEIFKFERNKLTNLGLDEYMAMVIESYLRAFDEILQKDALAIPVNYNETAVPIIQKLAAACGLVITDDELKAMNQRAAFHGKYPDQVFEEAPLTENIPKYLHNCFDWYHQLEKIRKNRS